ncbi:MAG: SusE domain-containing protein [Mediterranea sp.]|jgi:hypothetical protein|nr:SusE domain-containing protein [Mediterranea sp.]
MKKINTWLIASLSVFGLTLAGCETDNGSNPILQKPTSFVLNTPANAATNVYDLANSSVVYVTCSQPNYGFPASTIYSVQAALSPTFNENNYTTLATTSTSARVPINALELNDAILEMWPAANPGVEMPDAPIPVWIRLQAQITGGDGLGLIKSNVIELSQVLVIKDAPLTMPTEMYLLNPAGTWVRMGQVSGADDFYAIAYLPTDAGFKFGVKSGEAALGTISIATDGDSGAAVADDGTGGQHVQAATAGWYIVTIKPSIVDNAYQFELGFYPPNVYVIGNSMGNWDEDVNKFTVPADGTGSFVSPAMTAAGELRMYARIGSRAWYTTEFTLYNGTIFYRDQYNIASNWATDLGAAYSVEGAAGQKVTLDFTAGTGSVQ